MSNYLQFILVVSEETIGSLHTLAGVSKANFQRQQEKHKIQRLDRQRLVVEYWKNPNNCCSAAVCSKKKNDGRDDWIL
jgi:hypothetical protein